MASNEDGDQSARGWFDEKSDLMQAILGKEHHMVMHALIPYAIGGALDLYYYPAGAVPGTAIATKELSELPGEGSSNAVFRSYELVMFTKHPIDLDAARDEGTEFGRAHASINAILNCMARYSATAELNPRETCEFPVEMDTIGGKCLVFDSCGQYSDDAVADFGLLLLIEVFRSEMEFSRQHGGAMLLERLRSNGYYPYSDLDREPVA
jgi:hypothetical protein